MNCELKNLEQIGFFNLKFFQRKKSQTVFPRCKTQKPYRLGFAGLFNWVYATKSSENQRKLSKNRTFKRAGYHVRTGEQYVPRYLK